MNKTLKIISLVAVGFIVIGIGLGVLGATLGGSVYNLNFGHDRGFPLSAMEIPMESFSEISVNGSYMELIFTPSQTEEWKVTTASSRNTTPAKAEVTDGVLYITTDIETFANNQNRVVTVTYPSQTHFTKVDVILDAAEIDFQGFSTDNMILDLSAGEIIISQVVAEKSDITLHAGSLEVSNSTLNNISSTLTAGDFEANGLVSENFESNMKFGSLSLDGDLTGTISLDVATGDVELSLGRAETEYNMNLRTDIGEIEVNGHEAFRRYTSPTEGDYPLDMDVNMGSIEVDFIR